MVRNVITKVAILTLLGFVIVAFYANAYQEESIKKKPEIEKTTDTKTQKDETTLDIKKEKNTNVGFKPAGGVRNSDDAQVYITLVDEILGREWLNASHFRFGASSLLTNLLVELGHANQAADSSAY